MKDHFSENSNQYAQFRPDYPDAVFDYLKKLCPTRERAWDCGTGSGQVAKKLADIFDRVYATDISQPQLDHAFKKDNIHYSLQPAEQTDFPDRYFDLIVVAQAIHWFDRNRFYIEVRRTAKKAAALVIMGYGLLQISDEIDPVIQTLYSEILGQYWAPERKQIDDHYRTIPFPFEELELPAISNCHVWTYDHLIGYLHTWSAVRHYIRQTRTNPIDAIADELLDAWGDRGEREVEFPLLLRIGKL